ncbi:AMP-binding protein [Nocardioides sp. zg-1228]|uniref:AMP-binding protein n=1 Tax=Nocardioides sp. zg-1228 TaxID=2763008 RepID=UPI0016424D62|nr:AMP-binding protein [Nocardioides sp. zg-1228]MBC2931409.1 AMP-binding protein [Nocardioides sp. zg-1228]QSF57025.1 AMP-binding protein [Nocardioides sp. zg-1228]
MVELHGLVRAAAAGAAPPTVSDRRKVRPLSEVLEGAEHLAARIRSLSVRERPVVVARLPASVDAVEVLLAAVAGDLTFCFVDPSAAPERVSAIEAALDPDVVVDSEGLTGRTPTSDGPASGGYVATSSGSTGGAPKGVLSTWSCLAEFAPHGAAALRLGPGDRLAEPSHPAYDLSMTNWLLALASGASLVVSSALGDRMRPLAFLTRARATHVRVAPRFIDLARAERVGSANPVSLRVWGSGGDRLSHGQAEHVFGFGVPTLVNTYGTSETAGFASAAAFDRSDHLTSRHGSVSIGRGRVGPWRTAMVQEGDGDDVTEMLAVRSPHLGEGYLLGGPSNDLGGDPVYPRWETDRVVTGDLGCTAGDDLVCLGRSGRLVKRSGVFVNLDDVDRVLRETTGMDAITVAIRTGELVTLAVPAGDGDVDEERVGDLLAAHMSPDSRPDVLVRVDGIPRLANGKTDHAGALRLAEVAAAGS